MTRWEFLAWGLAGLAGIFSLIFVYRFSPIDYPYYPRCLFHDWTGLHCPGCGGFRAWHALLHGDVVTAISRNVLAVTLVPALVMWVAYQRLVASKVDCWSLPISGRLQLWLAGWCWGLRSFVIFLIPLFPGWPPSSLLKRYLKLYGGAESAVLLAAIKVPGTFFRYLR